MEHGWRASEIPYVPVPRQGTAHTFGVAVAVQHRYLMLCPQICVDRRVAKWLLKGTLLSLVS